MYLSLTPYFEGNPLTQGHEILSRQTRVFAAANIKDFIILACIVLIQLYNSVTDRRTPRPWLKRAKHSAIARKKWKNVIKFAMTVKTKKRHFAADSVEKR